MTERLTVFGAHRDEIWRALQAHLLDGRWDGAPLRVMSGPFAVTIDVHAELAGYATILLTRLRSAFVNPDQFRCRISRRTLLSAVASFFGAQDIEVGDAAFDREFVLQANQPEVLQRLLSDGALRAALLASPAQSVQVLDDEGWFGPEFPDGVDELRVEAAGRVTQPAQLEVLYGVFAEVLNRLCRLGAAYEDDPHMAL